MTATREQSMVLVSTFLVMYSHLQTWIHLHFTVFPTVLMLRQGLAMQSCRLLLLIWALMSCLIGKGCSFIFFMGYPCRPVPLGHPVISHFDRFGVCCIRPSKLCF